MSKKDMEKKKNAKREKIAELEKLASSGSKDAKKKLAKAKKKNTPIAPNKTKTSLWLPTMWVMVWT